MLNNTSKLMETINSLKGQIMENDEIINSLIPSIPSDEKGRTYNELKHRFIDRKIPISVVSETIYNLRMANSSLKKAISSYENLMEILNK